MTIVFSVAKKEFILMSVDSAITVSYENSIEYKKGEKSFLFDGVGCVTTWGARDHNKIGSYLSQEKISPETHDVVDLSKLVNRYLTQEFRPHELNLDDVGYHVGGFDKNGHPRLFHIFWGFDRPRKAEQVTQEYKICDHSPAGLKFPFLYNGRNDLVYILIQLIIYQIEIGQNTNFHLFKNEDYIYLADFINRFASEITPEVCPPFHYNLISPKNKIFRFENINMLKIEKETVLSVIKNIEHN